MALSFIHISDLHLGYTQWPSWAKRNAPSCDDIKISFLAEIINYIREKKPDVLFIAGDVTECHQESVYEYVMPFARKQLAPIVEACKCAKTEIIAIQGDHDPDCELLCSVLPGTREIGEIVEIKGYKIGCLGTRRKQVGVVEDFERWGCEHLDIAVVHSDKISASAFSKLGVRYLAGGHLHKFRHVKLSGITAVMPGHLCSYWDGDGKAWPTCFVSGVLDDKSCHIDCHVFKGPRTRQIFFDHETLYLKGCLSYEISSLTGDWISTPVSFWVDVETKLDREDPLEKMTMLLRRFSKDVFVTPVKNKKRVIRYGADILNNESELKRFVQYSSRASYSPF